MMEQAEIQTFLMLFRQSQPACASPFSFVRSHNWGVGWGVEVLSLLIVWRGEEGSHKYQECIEMKSFRSQGLGVRESKQEPSLLHSQLLTTQVSG